MFSENRQIPFTLTFSYLELKPSGQNSSLLLKSHTDYYFLSFGPVARHRDGFLWLLKSLDAFFSGLC